MRRRLANIAEALRLRLLPMEVGYLWPPIKGTFAKVRFRQVWRPSSSFLPMKQPRPGMAPLNTRRFTICGLTLPPKAALSFWMDLSRRPGRSLSLGKQTIRTADLPGRPNARRVLSELSTVLSSPCARKTAHERYTEQFSSFLHGLPHLPRANRFIALTIQVRGTSSRTLQSL